MKLRVCVQAVDNRERDKNDRKFSSQGEQGPIVDAVGPLNNLSMLIEIKENNFIFIYCLINILQCKIKFVAFWGLCCFNCRFQYEYYFRRRGSAYY